MRAVAVAAVLFSATGAWASDAVDRCRQADKEFDYEQAVQECALAAAEPNTTTEEKIDVFRLLGIAHTALKQDARAETWFLRLLVLDPTSTLDASVSPVYREAFAKAQKRFAAEGKVSVVVVEPIGGTSTGAKAVAFDVTDALGRVSAARLRVRAVPDQGEPGPVVDVALTRAPGDKPGVQRLSGEVLDPGLPAGGSGSYRVEYVLALLGPSGAEITPDPPLVPSSFPGSRTDVPVEGGGNGLLIAAIGGGAALGVVVLVVGGAAAVAVTCLTTDVCGGGETTSRVAVSPAQ